LVPALKGIAQAIIAVAMIVPVLIAHAKTARKQTAAAMAMVLHSTDAHARIVLNPTVRGPMKVVAKALAIATANKPATVQPVMVDLHQADKRASKVLVRILAPKAMATRALAISLRSAASPQAWAVQAHAVVQMSVVAAEKALLQAVAVVKA
jgi:hypothetical protein